MDCKAALNIKGEHFSCDWPSDEEGKHQGWGHTNKVAQAVWSGVGPDEQVGRQMPAKRD